MGNLSRAATKVEGLLSRVTSSGRFIPEIDGLRFIAVITVLLFHLNALTLQFYQAHGRSPEGVGHALDMFFRTGFIGVEIFFAISGFILGLPFALQRIRGGKRVRLPRYFLRRLTRLEPTYFVNMLTLFLLKVVAFYRWEGRPDLRPATMLPHLFASLIYSHNLIYRVGSTINNVAWSLEVEVQFYVLAPLICSLFSVKSRSTRRGALVALGIGAAVLDYLSLTMGINLGMTLLRCLPFFIVGLLVADVYVADWHEQPYRSQGWSWLAVAGCAGMLILARTGFVAPELLNGFVVSLKLLIGHALLALSIAMLFVGTLRGSWANRILRLRPVVLIGGMCYTIYLYHQSLYHLLGYWTASRWSWLPYGGFIAVQSLVLLIGCLALSAVLFVLFEKPFMYPDWPAKARATLKRWWRVSTSRD
ncbi:MAG: acyltransferase family protein, partial [Thermoanaerobaculia bacterium]